jgi:hypothetical protein
MTLKQKLLAIKQSNSIHPVQLDLVEWMLSCEYVTASRKKKGWGLYGPTYTMHQQLMLDKWKDYIL